MFPRTDGNPATTKQVGRVIGELEKVKTKNDKLEVDIEKLTWKVDVLLGRLGKMSEAMQMTLRDSEDRNRDLLLAYDRELSANKAEEIAIQAKRENARMAARQAQLQINVLYDPTLKQDNLPTIRARG